MINFEFLLYLTIAALFPIIPAYIFHKALPTKKTEIEGSFGSLKYKLYGSFGGYFVVFLVLLYYIDDYIDDKELKEIWRVEGKVCFNGGNQNYSLLEVKQDEDELFKVTTDTLTDNLKGEISVNHKDNEFDFPFLEINHKDDYKPAYFHLGDTFMVDIDYINKSIKIKKPIVLIHSSKILKPK